LGGWFGGWGLKGKCGSGEGNVSRVKFCSGFRCVSLSAVEQHY